MFQNYFKIAVRILQRNLGHSLVKLIGLSIGMASAFVIYVWVSMQLQIDANQKNAEQLYRFEDSEWVIQPPQVYEHIAKQSETEYCCRFYFWLQPIVKVKDESFRMRNFAYCDTTAFRMFNFDFIEGDPVKAIDEPRTVVLTKSMADRLFPDGKAMGKEILFNNKDIYKVSGIVKDIHNFHMNINAFAGMHNMTISGGWMKDILNSKGNNFNVYVQLKKNADPAQLVDKVSSSLQKQNPNNDNTYLLRPFKEIYFATGLKYEGNVKHLNRIMLIALSSVGIFILLLACFNFINLSTAKASLRNKEIAIRKVTGSKKMNLFLQFMGEIVLLIFLSLLLALILVELFLPYFSQLTQEHLQLNYGSHTFWIGISIVLVLTIFLSGMYPALFLSNMNPIRILAQKNSKSMRNGNLRKVLLITQFSITIFLLTASVIVYKQLHFMRSKDLGFQTEQVMYFSIHGKAFNNTEGKRMLAKANFRQQLINTGFVKDVTYMGQLPGQLTNTSTLRNLDDTKDVPVRVVNADPQFISVLGLKLVDGRNFREGSESDMNSVFILNETAVKEFGYDSPVGDRVRSWNTEIIGVVKDFHLNSLHKKQEAMIMRYATWPNLCCAKLSTKKIQKSITAIREVYEEFCPDFPFEYGFLDQSFDRKYKKEENLSQLLFSFVFIAIFLAGIGLLSLASFMAEQSKKEVGIRKSLGANTNEIVHLFSTGISKWIAIAFVISTPVAYWIMSQWLETYPYQTPISWWLFAFAGLFILVISLSSVSYQILRAAKRNPVDSLRYE